MYSHLCLEMFQVRSKKKKKSNQRAYVSYGLDLDKVSDGPSYVLNPKGIYLVAAHWYPTEQSQPALRFYWLKEYFKDEIECEK